MYICTHTHTYIYIYTNNTYIEFMAFNDSGVLNVDII